MNLGREWVEILRKAALNSSVLFQWMIEEAYILKKLVLTESSCL